MKKTSKVFIYIFCLLNSISGLQIAGISLYTIFVAIFATFIIYGFAKNGNHYYRISKRDYFAIYILCSSLSCIFSIFYKYILPHVPIVRTYLLNCGIYLVMFVLLKNYKTDYKCELISTFRNGLIFAARVQAVWGLLQFMLLYTFHLNINQILFEEILHSTNSRDWIMGFYNGNIWNMRITGLNYENSMFALVVCVGMALENNIIWKPFLMLMAVLSLSRTSWVMVAGYVSLLAIRWIMNKRKMISSRRVLAIIILFVVMFIVYFQNNAVQRQVSNIILRLTDSTALSVSASRHILYYPYGLLLWFTDANLLQKILGFGMRCSGVAFSQNSQVASIVGIYESFNNAWAVECDVIGLLLGGGLLTFLMYYLLCFSIFNNKSNQFRDVIFIILVGGITYHYHSISYVIFILMFAALEVRKNTKNC